MRCFCKDKTLQNKKMEYICICQGSYSHKSTLSTTISINIQCKHATSSGVILENIYQISNKLNEYLLNYHLETK